MLKSGFANALMVFAISLLAYVFRLTFFTLPWLIALCALFLAITAFRYYNYKSPYKRLRQIGEAIRKVMVTAGHLSDDQSRVQVDEDKDSFKCLCLSKRWQHARQGTFFQGLRRSSFPLWTIERYLLVAQKATSRSVQVFRSP